MINLRAPFILHVMSTNSRLSLLKFFQWSNCHVLLLELPLSKCEAALIIVEIISQSVQSFSPVIQSCLTHCDALDCSMPGFPVHHQLPESTQTHVHWVSDAIQPSYSLSSPPPPAFNLSQYQGLFIFIFYFF